MTEEKPAKKWRFDFVGGSEEISDEIENLEEESFFPLSQAKVGDRVWIVGLRNTQNIEPLLKMGLQPGNELEIVSHTSGGSIIVNFQGNSVGLSLNIACHVLVTNNSNLLQEN